MGKAATISPGEDPRRVFADWLVRPDNPWFARVLANRVWSWLVGRGVVEPADDVHRGNPAANLALLNYLATELVEAEYDPRHLYRVILELARLSTLLHSAVGRSAGGGPLRVLPRADGSTPKC
jgi:hypothetical protein